MYRVISSSTSYQSYDSLEEEESRRRRRRTRPQHGRGSRRMRSSKFASLLDQEEQSEVSQAQDDNREEDATSSNTNSSSSESVRSRSELSLYLEATKKRQLQQTRYNNHRDEQSSSFSTDTHSDNDDDDDDLSTCAHPGTQTQQQTEEGPENQKFVDKISPDESRNVPAHESGDLLPVTPDLKPNELVPVRTNSTATESVTCSSGSHPTPPNNHYYMYQQQQQQQQPYMYYQHLTRDQGADKKRSPMPFKPYRRQQAEPVEPQPTDYSAEYDYYDDDDHDEHEGIRSTTASSSVDDDEYLAYQTYADPEAYPEWPRSQQEHDQQAPTQQQYPWPEHDHANDFYHSYYNQHQQQQDYEYDDQPSDCHDYTATNSYHDEVYSRTQDYDYNCDDQDPGVAASVGHSVEEDEEEEASNHDEATFENDGDQTSQEEEEHDNVARELFPEADHDDGVVSDDAEGEALSCEYYDSACNTPPAESGSDASSSCGANATTSTSHHPQNTISEDDDDDADSETSSSALANYQLPPLPITCSSGEHASCTNDDAEELPQPPQVLRSNLEEDPIAASSQQQQHECEGTSTNSDCENEDAVHYEAEPQQHEGMASNNESGDPTTALRHEVDATAINECEGDPTTALQQNDVDAAAIDYDDDPNECQYQRFEDECIPLPPPSELLDPDESWWEEWDEEIERQMPSISAMASLSDDGQDQVMQMGNIQDYLRGVAGQDPILQGIAVAFYKGLSLQQERHHAKLKELQEQHERQLAMLSASTTASQTTPSNNSHSAMRLPGSSSCASPTRTEALRRRWRSKTSGIGTRSLEVLPRVAFRDDDNHADAEDDHHDTFTVATVLSTMSCRELSMERYRARILRQMKGPDAANLQQSQQPKESSNNDKKAEDDDKKNDAEIQRLLDELQQAERRQKKLEKQLQQAGVVLAEDIPYQEAKDQVARISKRMNEIGNSEAEHEDPAIQKSLREEYYRLEKDMERYISALMLTDEFMQEQKEAEEAWEEAHAQDNRQALQQMRRHMPVNIRMMTRQQLEARIPPTMAKKFQRTNVLQLLRRDPTAIARWHSSNLESLRLGGLTLTERRALHHHLLPAVEIWMERQSSSDALNERKLTWWATMRSNLKEALERYDRHVTETDGVTTAACHCCNLIGKQCPVRANAVMDYSGDLGFPIDDIYEESSNNAVVEASGEGSCSEPSSGSQQQQTTAQHVQEIISQERLNKLREHYKDHPNRIQKVSCALQVCEAMDEAMNTMDKQLEEWILQQLQQPQQASESSSVDACLRFLGELRSSLSSWLARDVESLSIVEVGLSSELGKAAKEYVAGVKENVLNNDGDQSPEHLKLKQILVLVEKKLHGLEKRNLKAKLNGGGSPSTTRKRKSRTEIMAELWKRGGSNPTKQSGSSKASDGASNSTPGKPQNSNARPKKSPAPNALLAAISARRTD